MKTKFCTFIAVILVIGFAGSARSQYGSGQGPAQPVTGASASGRNAGKKPGEVLTGGAIVATPITEEEAKKKYPMPGGKAYPVGDRDIHKPSGWVTSPYSGQDFDCTQIPYGGLVLDTKVNKVFVRPKTK
jgi:hypothetical protein